MDQQSTQMETPARGEAKPEGTDEPTAVWAELDRTHEGVSLTVYAEYDDGEVGVHDETWWTWPEFTGMSGEALNISEIDSVAMEPVAPASGHTVEAVLDAIATSPFSLVDFEHLKGTIARKPVFDTLEIPSEEAVKAALTEEL
ncbi:hypothetical protein GCM10027355_35930 [Haloplanus salinarum]|uniref:hypothetical protein n=1 Tax=Haloplanus salinarum TaxID=1912324 RepID=UPI003B4386DC